MEIPKRKLGKCGIEVSVIGMGMWAVGGGLWGPSGHRETIRASKAALELGISFKHVNKVERLPPLAEGCTLPQLALRFVIAHPARSVVIPGARTREQVRENVGAASLPPLTTQELAAIDAITPPGGGRKIWPA
jgi:aryl-alcohol dehydrogenase-like predicted oxidoreductase